jgi:hypothetical protein
MPAEASLAATDAPITPAPITTQRRDLTEAMAPTVWALLRVCSLGVASQPSSGTPSVTFPERSCRRVLPYGRG